MRLKALEWQFEKELSKKRGPSYTCFLGDTLGSFTIAHRQEEDAYGDKGDVLWDLFHNKEKISIEPDPMSAGRYAEEYLRDTLLELVLEDE